MTLTDRNVKLHNFELAWRAASIILIKKRRMTGHTYWQGVIYRMRGWLMPQQEVTLVKPQHEVTLVKPQQEITLVKPQQEVALVKPQQEFTLVKPQQEVTLFKPHQEVTLVKPQ